MARQKPILTHSRVARAIAGANVTPERKAAALGAYGKAVRAARGDGVPQLGGNLAGRIANARADARDAQIEQRTDRARAHQQRQLRGRVFDARKDALAPRKTGRSVGRERTTNVGFEGQPVSTPSARVDALKRTMSVGVSMPQRKVRPYPAR